MNGFPRPSRAVHAPAFPPARGVDIRKTWCHNGVMSTARPNQSLTTGVRCLQLIASSPAPVGSREAARSLGLEHTKVSRALGTLAMMGLAQRTADRKYRPGPALHVLAAQSLHGSGLLEAAMPHLRRLKWEGFTVALGVLWRRHVCYLVHARQYHALEEGIGRHELHPAARSSLGLILLAQEPEGAAEPLGPREAHAIAEARRTGHGLVRFPSGEVSVAVAIGEPAYGAMGVSAPDLTEEGVRELVGRLRGYAAEAAASVAARRSAN